MLNAQARLGKVTASRISDVMAKTRSGWGASRANYASALVIERLTGLPTDSYTNAAMQWGLNTEAEAKTAYEFFTGAEVADSDFVPHPTIEMAGCSPDSSVGTEGLVEYKCPNSSTHIETLLGASIDDKYIKQMQFQMSCTGRAWCDFCSFDPRLPANMQIKIIRVKRDDKLIAEIEKEVRVFLVEVEETVKKLQGLY